jgi:hypothetical protein
VKLKGGFLTHDNHQACKETASHSVNREGKSVMLIDR